MAESTDNPEIRAMATIVGALDSLDEDTQSRVLRWAVDRYRVSVGLVRTGAATPAASAAATSNHDHTELAELFAAADPQSDADKALVGAYWTQFVQGETDFDSQSVNTRLKNLGHGVGNITRALDTLKDRRPQLVVQLRKSGTSKQARKKYKVTAAGKSVVEAMIADKLTPGQ